MKSREKYLLLIEQFAERAERLLPNHPSLFSGLSGLSLLYAEMYRLSGINNHREHAVELIEKSIDLLDDEYSELTLANGVAGVGWVIKYLLKCKIIDESAEVILNDFDELLMEGLREDDFFENQTYDLLYGLIGKGVYFLDGKRKINNKALKLVFERLIKISSKNASGGITWYDSLGKEKSREEEDYFNYGLPHGLPGIILFLCKLSKKKIFVRECAEAIKSLVEQLQSTQLDGLESVFPINSRTTSASKLSWCYGDIGIAMAFLQASEILCDKNLRQIAHHLFIRSSARKLNASSIRTESGLIENGFCHGSFGLSYLFRKAYDKTQQLELLKASNYWVSAIHFKSSSSHSEIISQNYDFNNNTWRENGSLINGYCGMGLVLLNLSSKECRALENITLTAI